MIELYKFPSAMEPMLPTVKADALRSSAFELIRATAKLSGYLHPITRETVKCLLRIMNSYYSNLIEGHSTHPVDIERAVAKDYSEEPKKRALQLESAAHVDIQTELELRLAAEPDLNPFSEDTIKWVHEKFYSRLPEELHFVEDRDTGEKKEVVPGKLRETEVVVGNHYAPAAGSLTAFLSRFKEAYTPIKDPVERIIAAAASHHRLAWIHPFLDGNGRVTRLISHAALIRAECDGGGLWTLSRGLSFRRKEYYDALAAADSQRRGDYDGRGNLSDATLIGFCSFFIDTCLDQVKFMGSLLELDQFQQRLMDFADLRAHQGYFSPETKFLLREALLRGEFPRGEADRITGLPERTARDVLSHAVELGLLVSDTPKGHVRLGLPVSVCPSVFPKLFPETVELEIFKQSQNPA